MQSNINPVYITPQQPNFQAYPNGQAITSGAQKLEDNTLLKQAQKTQDNPAVLIAGTAGFGAALLWATSLLNKQLQGDYDKTLFGKIEKWGNDVGNKNSVSAVGGFLKNLGSWVNTNIISKSEILNSMKTKPSIGGNMVQGQAAGTLGHISNSIREYMEFYDKQHGTSIFKDIIEKSKKDSHKYVDEMIDIINKNPHVKNEIMNKSLWWMPKFLSKGTTFGELINKVHLTKNYKDLSRPLGAKLSGATFRSLEALSNGMAAGKVAVLLQAFFLAQSLKESIDAPKGDKFKTFAESMASFMAMMLTMGLQLRVFNAAAGLKFIGMKPEDYKKYHSLIERINGAAIDGDKAAYDALKSQLNAIKKEANKNVKLYQKPFKWIGNILSWGRIKETVRPLSNVSKSGSAAGKLGAGLLNSLKLAPYAAKLGFGYVGRFLFIATTVMSLFTDTAVKISHKIFGRPQKSILDKEPDETSSEKQSAETNAPDAAIKSQLEEQLKNSQTQIQPTYNPAIKYQEGNLLTQMRLNQGKLPQTIGSQTLSSNTIPSQSLNSSIPASELKRTYIPSPILGQETVDDPVASRSAQIDAVLRQADLAEAQAQKFLNNI